MTRKSEAFDNEMGPETGLAFKFMPDKRQRLLLAERVMDLVKLVREREIKEIVFLDKSARPISAIFLALWQKSENSPAPHINFLNVGSELEKRLERALGEEYLRFPSGISEDEYSEWLSRYRSFLDGLSSETIQNLVHSQRELERIREQYSYLKNASGERPVLLVDEVTITGRSLAIAERILKEIFPRLRFEYFSVADPALKGKDLGVFQSFADGDASREDGLRIAQAPWYKERTGLMDNPDHSLTVETERSAYSEILDDGGRRGVSDKIKALREEMLAIADEYWQEKHKS